MPPFNRAIVIVLDSVGVGELPDADRYGDAGSNTLSFQDPTMSTQHLRVTLDEDEIFLVDLGSTNGVLLGERRVDAVRLHPGDRFRAGMIEFEIGLHHASTV